MVKFLKERSTSHVTCADYDLLVLSPVSTPRPVDYTAADDDADSRELCRSGTPSDSPLVVLRPLMSYTLPAGGDERRPSLSGSPCSRPGTGYSHKSTPGTALGSQSGTSEISTPYPTARYTLDRSQTATECVWKRHGAQSTSETWYRPVVELYDHQAHCRPLSSHMRDGQGYRAGGSPGGIRRVSTSDRGDTDGAAAMRRSAMVSSPIGMRVGTGRNSSQTVSGGRQGGVDADRRMHKAGIAGRPVCYADLKYVPARKKSLVAAGLGAAGGGTGTAFSGQCSPVVRK